MGYLIGWDNEEKTVVFQQYTGIADKDDLYKLAEESAHMLKSVPHRVHLIIDEHNVKMNLNAADMKHLENLVPPNQGGVVLVVHKNSLPYKKYLHDVGAKVAPKTFEQPFFAAAVEEARQFLQTQFDVRYP
jgi:hypothetical protein